MRNITDLKTRGRLLRPPRPSQASPLDLRGKGSDTTASSRHIIDLTSPTKNRQQLMERIRRDSYRDSFFEAIPIAATQPHGFAPAYPVTNDYYVAPDLTDRIKSPDHIVTTSLARWRRHWRSHRRRWRFEASVFLAVTRQRMASWARGLPWQRATIIALTVAAAVAAAYGLYLITHPVTPATNPSSGTPLQQTADRSNGNNSNAPGGADGQITPAIDPASSPAAPVGSGGGGRGPGGTSAPITGGSGSAGGGGAFTPTPVTPTPTLPVTPPSIPPVITVPPVTLPPIETPILDTPIIETPGIEVPGVGELL